MTTFTKEQVQKIIEAADEVITALAGTNEDVHPESDNMLRLWDDLNDRFAPPAVVKELARIALASLEAVPVAYVDPHVFHNFSVFRTGETDNKRMGREWMWANPDAGLVPVYTAPPAPVVPDALASDIDADDHPLLWSYNNGWNACRAAMQGKAESSESLSSNSPVIPDGWVACSERMPHIGVPVITCCGDVVQYAVYAWDGKEWQDWYEEYDRLPASTFTHWHSRPAAPQQEVKS